MVSLRIHGRERLIGAIDGGPAGEGAEVAREFELDLARSSDLEPVVLDLADEDVVEFETPEGAVILLRGDELDAFFARDPQARSAPGGIIEISAELPPEDAASARGGLRQRVRARIMRVLGREIAARGAVAIAARFEDHSVAAHGQGHGLLRWNGASGPEGFAPVGELPADGQPWLVFLHGTASSTSGSFGGLVEANEGRFWAQIEARYRDRILCLEHRSLTESPIRNALALVQALPAGAELHLVSHSRGGLIGELLCRAQLSDAAGAARPPFLEDELNLFDEPGHAGQRDDLVALGRLLQDRRIRVTRFVRTACPAAGTGLMSDRLDRWVNLLLNGMLALGSAVLGPVGMQIADGLRTVLRALVKERTNPQSLPGLAAMAPEQSRLLDVLNLPEVRLQGSDLVVIAGDIESGSIWQRVAVLITDRFFGQSHDLVVESASMHRGMTRARSVHYHFEQGPKVNHFSYFSNAGSARLVADALTDPAALEGRSHPLPAGFESPAEREEAEPLISRHRSGQRDVPVLMLLPGVNGSHLADARGRIWLHPLHLITGGIRRLDIAAPDVRPDGVLNRYYRDLFRYLDRSHEVITWPYDWRRSLLETADLFAAELERRLSQTDQPVRIVAHSMGGLVARTAFARQPQLWARFRARAGARLVMLGTPNGGSFAIPLMLLGQERLMKLLARFDLRHGAAAQLSIVSRWPGVAQMLPVPVGGDAASSELDLFSAAGWERLRALDPGGDWVAPDARTLALAREFRRVYDSAPSDPGVMAYIAGQNTTYAALFAPAPGQPDGFRFGLAEQGDGRVLWRTGIPCGLPVWFTDAAHGDLARHGPAFPAILEILESGSTTRLATTPPAVRTVTGRQAVVGGESIERLPEPEELFDIAMAARPMPEPRHAPRRHATVRVSNGHLKFARFPLVVGHYSGDGLTGTERALDREQGGRLSRRLARGIHPGEIGASDAHLALGQQPPGALIVGLGPVTGLTSGGLRQTVLAGLMNLASAREELAGTSDWHRQPNGVSFVMVGTGGGVMPIKDCLLAILRAVSDANAELGDEGFEEVEFVENIEQRAIGAWQALRSRIGEGEFQDSFTLAPDIERRRGAWSRMAFDDDSGWWTPITIREDDAGDGALHYVAIAGRARAEAHLVSTRRAFVDRYLDDLTGRRMDESTLASARTLFELLWPNALKEHSLDDSNIRLILDRSAAALPWEMLDDRRPWLQLGTAAMNAHRGPPAVRHGMLRQLVSTPSRIGPSVEAARGKALVIGDPCAEPSDFSPLPAAQREARQIARMLSAEGFEVTVLIGEDARPHQVITALLTEAWQVVHIAAHGVFNHRFGPAGEGRAKTGVILGGVPCPVVLDSSILAQMPVTPELFFVNCCHLGALGDGRAAQASRADRPELAGSIAEQLIDMGLRAVVVAGWEVSDAQAQAFAEHFYRAMLRGSLFGEATKRARQAIYVSDPGDTTWGAYQAYGHPEFRLTGRDDSDSEDTSEIHLATPSEAISEIGRIGSQLAAGDDGRQKALAERLEQLGDHARERGWFNHGALLAALGKVWAELRAFDKAVAFYRAAVALEDGAAGIAAVEQLADLEAREAVCQWRDGAEAAGALEKITAAIARLEALNRACGETQDRLCLLGSAWKRLAQVGGAARRNRALDNMARAYEQALAMAPEGEGWLYPAAQAHLARVLQEITATGKAGKELRARHGELLRAASAAQRPEHASRSRLYQVDLPLLDAVLAGDLPPVLQARIAGAHAALWRDGDSWRARCGVIEQIEFLLDVLSRSRRVPRGLLAALEELWQAITADCP